MKKKNDSSRGSLDVDTLFTLNAISNDILKMRNLCIILSQYWDSEKNSTISPQLRGGYEVLNEVIYTRLLDLADELKSIIDEIEVKKQ